jgi:hypothetical protein
LEHIVNESSEDLILSGLDKQQGEFIFNLVGFTGSVQVVDVEAIGGASVKELGHSYSHVIRKHFPDLGKVFIAHYLRFGDVGNIVMEVVAD